MGNGILFNLNCCTKNDDKIKDVDINKVNSNMNTVKDLNSPKKEIKNERLMVTDIKNNKYNSNNFVSFRKRNFTQKSGKRNSDYIQNQNISLFNNTFQILKNNQYISFSNMNIFRNNANNRPYNSYFNSQLGKNSSFFSGINDKFDANFKNIKVKLKLSGELFCNNTLLIDKYGLKNSLKKKLDGFTSFGIKNKGEINKIHNSYDYIFEQNIIDRINKNRKHNSSKVFDILLDKKEKVYVLFFTHSSLLLYYKINDKLALEPDKDYYLILGSIFLSLNIKKSIKIKINIEIELESEKSKKYIFELHDMPIKIGRSNCSINIQKSSISKLHAIIYFEKDTFFFRDENSTNGSTLLIKEDDFLKLKGNMNFKLEDIPFIIEEINENSVNDINDEINNEDFDEDEEDEEDEK